MRVVAVTVLILILFFTCSLYMNYYINESSQKVVDKIEKLQDAIVEDSWQEAELYLQETVQEWHRTKRVWLIFLEHYEIDSIDIVLARLRMFVSIEKATEALGEIAELKLLVKHVVEKESFKLANIL